MSGAVIVCAVSPAETLPGRAKSMAVAITRVPVMKRLNVVPSLVPFVFFIVENLNPFIGRENTPLHNLFTNRPAVGQKPSVLASLLFSRISGFKKSGSQNLSCSYLFVFLFIVRSVLRPTSFFGLFSGYFRPKSPFFLRATFKSPVTYLKL